jgi:hypothetical protein
LPVLSTKGARPRRAAVSVDAANPLLCLLRSLVTPLMDARMETHLGGRSSYQPEPVDYERRLTSRMKQSSLIPPLSGIGAGHDEAIGEADHCRRSHRLRRGLSPRDELSSPPKPANGMGGNRLGEGALRDW